MKSFRERRAWLVGLSSIVLISLGLGLAFSVNRFEGLRGVYAISADLEDAAGLQPGNEVRIAGVKIGRVTDVSLAPSAARIEMEIDDTVDIPRESRLEVKLKTLLGQKFIDLQMPEAFVQAAAEGADLAAVADYFEPGDVIPIEQTKIPYEIHQAATEGTEVLTGLDKKALRRMLRVLGGTFSGSKEELGRALEGVDAVTGVLSTKSDDIARLLRGTRRVTGTLAGGSEDFGVSLERAAEVLEVLARRRATLSSLLRATDRLTENLGLVVQAARAPIRGGITDLNSILVLAEGELESIEAALAELGTAQELFGQPVTFGRFVEGHVCAVTSEDTCVPDGSPEDPGLPVHNVQPQPTPAAALRGPR